MNFINQLIIKHEPDASPEAVSVQWDDNNKELDDFMGVEVDTSFESVMNKNLMWIESVKKLLKWEKGQQLNFHLKMNCDGAFMLFKSHVCEDIIIDEEGYVNFAFFHNYYTNKMPLKEIGGYKTHNTKHVVRVNCPFNDKVYMKSITSKYWDKIRKEVFRHSIAKKQRNKMIVINRLKKIKNMENVVFYNKCKEYGYKLKKYCWKEFNDMYMEDLIPASIIVSNVIYSGENHKTNKLLLTERSMLKLKNNIDTIPSKYFTKQWDNERFNEHVFKLEMKQK